MVAINRNIQQIKELHNQGKFSKQTRSKFHTHIFILSNGGYKDTVPLLYYLKIVVQYAVDI